MSYTKFLLSLPVEVKTRLREQASEKGLSLTAYTRMILTEKARLNKPLIKVMSLPEIKRKLKKEAHKGIIIKDEFNTLNKSVLSEIAELAKKARE